MFDAHRENGYLDRERNENNQNLLHPREVSYNLLMERLHLPPFEGTRSKYEDPFNNCFEEHFYQI